MQRQISPIIHPGQINIEHPRTGLRRVDGPRRKRRERVIEQVAGVGGDAGEEEDGIEVFGGGGDVGEDVLEGGELGRVGGDIGADVGDVGCGGGRGFEVEDRDVCAGGGEGEGGGET